MAWACYVACPAVDKNRPALAIRVIMHSWIAIRAKQWETRGSFMSLVIPQTY